VVSLKRIIKADNKLDMLNCFYRASAVGLGPYAVVVSVSPSVTRQYCVNCQNG